MKAVFRIAITALCFIIPGSIFAFPEGGRKSGKIGGMYATLEPYQRRLVDNWFDRYNEVMESRIDAEEGYDRLPLSARSTYDAVTHALHHSKLSDRSGRLLGSSIDLIDYIEAISGRIHGAGGDVQFRIYAALNENAVEVLNRSREFQRKGDNTVYHKGYPTNYRQKGGAPSIQISIARNGRRADIDVDYRASGFPRALVNGHLTAANSDVRAGNNYQRHTGRWSGLFDWWRQLFGVPISAAEEDEAEQAAPGSSESLMVPRIPKDATVVDAARDFLNAWLVEQNPDAAMAYISRLAYSCVNQIPSDEIRDVDPGIAPHYIRKGMRETSQAVGRVPDLASVLEGVRPTNPELKLKIVPHQDHSLFVIYTMPEELALSLDCSDRLNLYKDPMRKELRREYGEYFGTSLRIKTKETPGSALHMVWAREDDFWKIVSWAVEPVEIMVAVVPRIAQHSPEHRPPQRIPGDPELIGAVKSFFVRWLVEKDIRAIAGFISSDAYQCMNYYRKLEGQAGLPEKDLPRELLSGFEELSSVLGRRATLNDAMESVEPSLDSLKWMNHPDESAFTLVAVPEDLASGFLCSHRDSDWQPGFYRNENRDPVRYFATIFRLKIPGEPAALNLLWARQSDRWKIVSLSVETP